MELNPVGGSPVSITLIVRNGTSVRIMHEIE